LTVERLEDGESQVSCCDEVVVGDELEVRGPIGGWFVWPGDGPALLVGGGSGVVPLMAMLRLARRLGRTSLIRLVVSARSPEDLYYADELAGPRRRSSTPAARRPRGPIRPAAWSSRTSTAPSVGRPAPMSAGRPIRRCSHVAGRAVWDHRRAHPGRAVRSDLLNHPARFPACRERRAQLTGGQLLHDLETPCLAAPCASGPTR